MARSQLRQLICDRVFVPRNIRGPEAVEAPLKLPNLFNIWCHLWTRILLVHLLDDQLRVTLDDDLVDAEANGSTKSRKQAFVLHGIVRDVIVVEHLDDILQAVARR